MSVLLNEAHRSAFTRRRRVIVNFDVTFWINVHYRNHGGVADVEAFVNQLFDFADDKESQIDSIWWNWGEGNQAPYLSDQLPLYEHPLYQGWVKDGIDIVGLVLDATRRRGIEVFFSHRMNGSDNDLGPFAVIPHKVTHRDLTFRTPWCTHENNSYWDFSHSEVHEYVLDHLREVAERWDFDGFELDFARAGACFPQGTAWQHRDRMTEFMRKMREMLARVGEARGRPILLATRVPENLVGSHFDGLDVEMWTQERLVDLLVLGVRSFDVDLIDFRRIVKGRDVKLYPSLDDHHASDGYQNPGIEVFRGVASTWYHDGADGVHTFNFNFAENMPYGGQDWESHLQAYREIGDCDTIRGKDKRFVVQRRGGGHGPSVVPNPEDWFTPRHAYANTNMLAQLPAVLDLDGRADTLITLRIGDDFREASLINLRVLLSDPEAVTLTNDQRLPAVEIATIGHAGGLMNEPPAPQIAQQLGVRINNCLLQSWHLVDGWLVYDVIPAAVAIGDNLIGLRIEGRGAGLAPVSVEKLELLIRYDDQKRLPPTGG